MKIEITKLIETLNHHDLQVRLDSLQQLILKIETGEIEKPPRGRDVNNHIHTTYSFSPYSPTKAVWMANQAGLATAGIMDHDSINGAAEFIRAGKIAGIATTIGIECRVDFSRTPLNGRRINNPDQASIAYIALHGIPHTQTAKVREFFKPYTHYRNLRNQAMVVKINELIAPAGIALDFAKEVVPVSNFEAGGSITERHLLYALSLKLIAIYGKGTALVRFLKEKLALTFNSKLENYLIDPDNPFYAYDLLGLLKSELVAKFYIDATLECPDVTKVISFAKESGAIAAYAYLGDIADSVTGDKKNQKFEDGYLDQLFEVLKELEFNAVTYMPSRNSTAQLNRVRDLCERYSFFQVSGEDINSPRQSFICEALRNEAFQNLLEATWALIGHEIEATKDLNRGMFSAATIKSYPDLKQRIQVFQKIGRQLITSCI